ncbi:glycosyltransferase [Sinomonas albida]|uniref:glycosyltransferase n=1 Tax=Sinomonas albida TaxID=369942 RepID=UPI0014579E3F|nr:glycosyltransferase [Sinomonas albida]
MTRASQIITLHDLIHLSQTEHYTAKRAYYAKIVRPTVQRSGLVLTVSETSKSAIENWLDDPTVTVINAGNGCSSAFLSADRIHLSKPDRTKYFLYVGNSKPHKNLKLLLSSIAMNRSLNLKIVSNDVSQIQSMCRETATENQVEIKSDITDDDLAVLYANAVATVIPSSVEGFGLPAVESLAVGAPVVYWHGCESVREIVGERGIAIDRLSTEELSSALTALSHGEGAPVTVSAEWKERYSWDNVASNVHTAIVDLASGPPRLDRS